MASPYQVFRPAYISGSCTMHNPRHVPHDYKLFDCLPFAHLAPDGLNATFTDEPDRRERCDIINSPTNLLVISERLHDFLQQALNDEPIEFIPIHFIDHKATPISEKYWAVNALEPVDCLDKEQSIYEPHAMDETMLVNVKKIVLKEEKMIPKRRLFKIEGIDLFIFSNDLVEEMSGFTNLAWHPLDKYSF